MAHHDTTTGVEWRTRALGLLSARIDASTLVSSYTTGLLVLIAATAATSSYYVGAVAVATLAVCVVVGRVAWRALDRVLPGKGAQ